MRAATFPEWNARAVQFDRDRASQYRDRFLEWLVGETRVD